MASTLYLRHRDGATHGLSGRRLAKLVKDLQGPESEMAKVRLMEEGYTGFISLHPDHADYTEAVDITELAAKYIPA